MKPKNYAYRTGALEQLIKGLEYNSEIFKLLGQDREKLGALMNIIGKQVVKADQAALDYENQ